jgi:uncharacterized membrane protein
MYLLDPQAGTRRRARLRDAMTRAAHKTGDALGATSRDLVNRTRGLAAGARGWTAADSPSDEVLVARVRARLGRFVSHPRSIEVVAHGGRVTLSGPILEHEADAAVVAISRVPGVESVDDALERHREPGNVPGLQGGSTRPGQRMGFWQESWAPANRVSAGAAGGALLLAGVRRGGFTGGAFALSGALLLARALTNLETPRLVGATRGRRAVEFQKTLTILAPVQDVFAFWQHYENFPYFMTHVREVRNGSNGISHWKVEGPAGIPVTFDAITTELVPNEQIAWRTVAGSVVGHAGVVRFEPIGDSATRVHVRFSYNPPGGAAGHAMAWLFGADAKQLMDDDLVRMKTLIETGKTPHDASWGDKNLSS